MAFLSAWVLSAVGSSPAAAADGLAFIGPENGEYQFDTGMLKGVLHRGGRSTGLLPVSDVATGKVLTKSMGWLSPYRTLSTGTQHGYGAWDWASETKLLPDGAVEVRWLANDTYPLNMTAVYRWNAANTADLEIAVTPQKDLPKLEIFVASYFEGFTQAFVYAQDAAAGQAKFVPALKEDAVWHVFPRDGEVAKLVGDGRWQHPPAPVTWTVRESTGRSARHPAKSGTRSDGSGHVAPGGLLRRLHSVRRGGPRLAVPGPAGLRCQGRPNRDRPSTSGNRPRGQR